jgi:hypothetical protein
VRHSKIAPLSPLTRVLRSLACLPPILLLTISGFLPLYHADGELRTWVSAARSVSKEQGEGFSAERGPGPREIHFCAVCAFTKGMNGALHVASGQLLPPHQASAILAVASRVAPRWRALSIPSRALPPNRFSGERHPFALLSRFLAS